MVNQLEKLLQLQRNVSWNQPDMHQMTAGIQGKVRWSSRPFFPFLSLWNTPGSTRIQLFFVSISVLTFTYLTRCTNTICKASIILSCQTFGCCSLACIAEFRIRTSFTNYKCSVLKERQSHTLSESVIGSKSCCRHLVTLIWCNWQY